jgi:hypothetical protein
MNDLVEQCGRYVRHTFRDAVLRSPLCWFVLALCVVHAIAVAWIAWNVRGLVFQASGIPAF